MTDTRDAAWWGREVDRLIAEIQAAHGVPDEPMEQLMRAMIIACRMDCEAKHTYRVFGVDSSEGQRIFGEYYRPSRKRGVLASLRRLVGRP